MKDMEQYISSMNTYQSCIISMIEYNKQMLYNEMTRQNIELKNELYHTQKRIIELEAEVNRLKQYLDRFVQIFKQL